MKEQLLDVWGAHPARRLSFDTVYQGLLEHVKARNLTRVVEGDLELFNYTVHTQYNALWDVFTLIARGLILDVRSQCVVATPFPKFFNFGEAQIWNADQVPGDIWVANKVDGSLGIVFCHAGRWRVATRGSFTSAQAVWAEHWLHTHVPLSQLEVGHTYLFEIIYAANRIVVTYDFEGLVLLGAYDTGGWEYTRAQIEQLGEVLKLRVVDMQPYVSVEQLLDASSSLGKESEGWVIRFGNGHRLKVKGAEYCRIQRLLMHITPLGVWEMLLHGDDLDVMRAELPEEHLIDFDQLRAFLESKFETLVQDVSTLHEAKNHLSDKDIGLALQQGQWSDGTPVTMTARKLLFAARKQDFLKVVHQDGHRLRRVAFDLFRPTGNVLEGYVASSAILRFQEEG